MQRELRSVTVTAVDADGNSVCVTMRNQTMDPLSGRAVRRWLAARHPNLRYVYCADADECLDADEEAQSGAHDAAYGASR